jgi:hypothetical protein
MKAASGESEMKDHLKNLMRWIILVPVVMIVLFACGQLALTSARAPSGNDPQTRMRADYRIWDFAEFQPVQSGILDEIFKDRSRYANGAPPSLVILPGQVWPTQYAIATVLVNTPQPSPLLPSPSMPAATSMPFTATAGITPSATKPVIIVPPSTATEEPPAPTRTPIPANTAVPTAIPTAIPTDVPTAIPTIVPTQTPASTPLNIGGPDNWFLSISGGNEVIIDLLPAIGRPLITSNDAAYDLVFYERVFSGSDVAFDHVILQVGTGPSGSCSSSTWYTVFYWGDSDPANNGHIGSMFGPTEIDNQSMSTSVLYNQTGVAIDADALGVSGTFPCLRIISPLSGDGDAAEVDAIEILS